MAPEQAMIDFVFLARHAEAFSGVLNVVGGCATDLERRMPRDQGVPLSHFGIAVSISIPWTETNRQHTLNVRVVNEDETATVVSSGKHVVTVGRPPTLAPGTIQHVVLGISADVIFPQAGGYCIIADLDDGTDMRRWPFHVHDGHPIVLTPMS